MGYQKTVWCMGLALLLLVIGLWNATLPLSEKGYYGMSYLLALYSAVTVQKNVPDNQVSAGTQPAALSDE